MMNEARKWKKMVSLVVVGKKPSQPLKKAKLTLTRYSSVCPDSDGLVSGFKRIVDGLVEAGILENDKFVNIGMPDYRWEKALPKNGRVTVTVEECPYTHDVGSGLKNTTSHEDLVIPSI